jgi:hypothetical protein
MKLILQIAAGIVVACGVLWLGSLVVMGAALQTFDSTLKQLPVPSSVQAVSPSLGAEREQAERQARFDAEQARQQAQAARCSVKTADGRLLHCDPRGPLTPR